MLQNNNCGKKSQLTAFQLTEVNVKRGTLDNRSSKNIIGASMYRVRNQPRRVERHRDLFSRVLDAAIQSTDAMFDIVFTVVGSILGEQRRHHSARTKPLNNAKLFIGNPPVVDLRLDRTPDHGGDIVAAKAFDLTDPRR